MEDTASSLTLYRRSVSDSALHLHASPAAVLLQRLKGRERLHRSRSPDVTSWSGAQGRAVPFWKEELAYYTDSVLGAHWALRPLWLAVFGSFVYPWKDQGAFWIALLGLLPLAQLIGDATDDVASSVGSDKISGLISATMGNLVEMIMSVSLLRSGEVQVLQTMLIGSVLSNSCLVFGSALLCAGMAVGEGRGAWASVLEFDPGDAGAEITSILLSAGAVALHSSAALPAHQELTSSRVSSVIMVSVYCLSVLQQLLSAPTAETKSPPAANAAPILPRDPEAERVPSQPLPEDGEHKHLLRRSLTLLTATAVVTGIVSETLTDALGAATSGLGISPAFVGMVLLPVAGNACEHATALRFAAENRADLALGISLGSAVQVATFVLPFCVLMATLWTDMTLSFGVAPAACLVVSTLAVQSVVSDGRGTKMEGLSLIGLYCLMAAYFACVPEA